MTAPAQPLGSQHRSLDRVVRDELLRRILSGELAPGARLVELTLAAELGVSRGPVRAAIRQLEVEGFVVVSPRRGASVADNTPTAALECYEVRAVLEQLAAQLAATRRRDEDIARMRAILDEGYECIRMGRPDELARLNNEFHAALAEASGNKELVVLLQLYAKRIAWMFARSADERGPSAWEEHSAIVDAIERRQADAAADLATAHIEASRRQFLVATPVMPKVPGPTGSAVTR